MLCMPERIFFFLVTKINVTVCSKKCYMQKIAKYFFHFHYRCFIDGLDSVDSFASVQNGSWFRNATLLQGGEFESQSNCQSHQMNQTLPLPPTNASAMACSRWVYDKSQYKTTIVSDVSRKFEWRKYDMQSFYHLNRGFHFLLIKFITLPMLRLLSSKANGCKEF